MEQKEFLSMIEQRLAALEARVEAVADPRFTQEVKRTIDIARVDRPFALAKARYVLELIILDIYRRERREAEAKPLFNMIEALCAQKGLFSPRIATDINYIRINGNLIVHAQDEPVYVNDREVEVIVLMTINLVEWYLTDYLPGRTEARGDATPLVPPPPNPYRGLLAFREEDAPNYFGREVDVADVLAAVARQPLVAVVGPSGSGKSSLVYAGVVATLRGTADWVIAAFRPRGQPYQELAQALVALWPADPVERLRHATKLARHWSAAEVPLVDAVQETLRQAGGRRLLLVADQFEELYTLGTEPAVAQGFLDLLVQAVEAAQSAAGQGPILCLLPTLRADFLGHALSHQGLAAIMDRYPKKLLGPIANTDRLRAIIEQPARRAGVVLEGLLAERILRDLTQLPGDDRRGGGASLPLLEFTLAQLWGRQRERRVTHLDYEELGGIRQALSRHADAVYGEFDEPERERLRHVLVQMVRPGEGTEDTRQVATREQIRPENWPLVVRLADARLVVTRHEEAGNQVTAEIVHEALIQRWPPLREWLREDRAFRLWQNGLRQAQAAWERTGRDPGALLAGARLAEAEERLATRGERLGEGETAYIQASLARCTAEIAARERQRRDRERLQRRISQGLTAFLVLVVGLAGVAGWQWKVAKERGTALIQSLEQEEQARNLAEERSQEAHRQARFAFSRQLTAEARALADRYPQRALLLAVEAMRGPLDADQLRAGWAETLLRELLLTIGGVPLQWDGDGDAVSIPAFDPRGRWLASGRGDGTARLWDLDNPQAEPVVLHGHKGGVSTFAFDPRGRWLASGGEDGTARLWDLDNPQAEPVVLREHEGRVSTLAFDPRGRWLASGGEDGTARLWDIESPPAEPVLLGRHEGVVSTLAFDPRGRWLASGDGDLLRTVRLWDLDNPRAEPVVLRGHKNVVFTLAFDPRGRWLAGGGTDGARLWDLGNPHAAPLVLSGQKGVFSSTLAFDLQGRWLASGGGIGKWGGDGTVRLWDLDNPQAEPVVLCGQEGPVSDLTFDPLGRWLASSGGDFWRRYGTARLWHLDDPQAEPVVLRGHEGLVSSITFDPRGRWLASGGKDGTRLWNLTNSQAEPVVLRGRKEDDVLTLAFDPQGRWLAGGVRNNWQTVRLWDLENRQAEPVGLRGQVGKVSTVALDPRGRWLASGGDKILQTVRLWDFENPQAEPLVLGRHEGGILVLAFDPQGHWLASGGGDGTARLWDLGNPQAEPVVLRGHEGGVTTLAFDPRGRWLASGGGDGTARLWNLGNPQAEPVVLRGHKGVVLTLAFDPQGRWVASGGDDGSGEVRLWDLRIDSLLELACRTAGRNLTPDEWAEHMGNRAYRATCSELPPPATAHAMQPSGSAGSP